MSVHVAAGLSTLSDSKKAAREAATKARDLLQPHPPNLAFVFHSPHHIERIEEVVSEVVAEADGAALLGCTTETVIGDGQEIEEGPAISVWMASLQNALIESFEMKIQETPDGHALVGFPLIGSEAGAAILLADPFTFPVQALLDGLNGDYPSMPVLGGMSSGGPPGRRALIHNDQVHFSGAVGVILGGPTRIEPIVSQGCKPIGAPFVVTASERNVILELGGQPPLYRLREIAENLAPGDQALVQEGLHIGVVIDEYNSDPGRGDFLIRGVLQANLATGAMAVGDYINVGQTIQFHLRDAESADRELASLLEARTGAGAAGALMFICNGRGSAMFGNPNHDVHSLESSLGCMPAAGMFCQGEIGPIGGRNYIHGFTASIALFEDAGVSRDEP